MITSATSLRRAFGFALAVFTGTVLHADLPWRREVVTVKAERQPAGQLLRAFAAEHALPLQLTEQAQAPVSGDFQGLTPRQFLDAVCDASQLVWFWDGARLHIDAAADVRSRPLNFDALTSERALAAFQSLGFESGPPARPTSLRGTNTVFTLVGGPHFIEVAEPVLRALDTQEKARRAEAEAQAARDDEAERIRKAETQVRVFRLKYASASDLTVQGGSAQSVVPGVARALQNIMGTAPTTLSTGGKSTDRKRAQTGLRGTGLIAVGQTPPSADNAASARAGEARTDAQEKHEALIQADPRLNAVIVRDLTIRMPEYEALIEQLDVSSPVIEISAAVVDIEANNGKSLGVEFLSFGDGKSSTKTRLGFEADRSYNNREDGNTSASPGFVDGTDLVRGPGVLSSVLVPVSGYQLLTRIRALEEKGEAQLVTSPSVITLENVEANLRQEETVFVRVAGREATDLFDVHAGVQLRVTPTVVREGDRITFRLVVSVQDGSFSDLLVDGVPSTRESAINTQAIVPADRTLLIGGYFVERQNNNARQVPGLGNVPLLGRLFKRTENNRSRAQRYFFITPRLVDIHQEARLNKPAATPEKSPLPAALTHPDQAANRAHELVGRTLPPVATHP
ncbi:type III secretion system outer membrane ring subunit SctC [Horticoccus sp. 23ND18S-11]|uniref:type III secretion system outer membrane ring subunit SctC n=1 Tax=Horticoccus sp. 23ND18S-11 TaxID=3391832 RepID=UPI0039C9680F